MADSELTLNKALDDRKKMECDINHLILKREELSGQAEVAKFELEAYRKEAQEARCSVGLLYTSKRRVGAFDSKWLMVFIPLR